MTIFTEEEQKALDYQIQERRRWEFWRFLQNKLKPVSQEPAEQTRRNWEPVRRP